MSHTQEKKQSIEIIPEKAWMSDLLYEDFQLAIMNTFEELRKSCKELKGRKRIMSHQIENINKENRIWNNRLVQNWERSTSTLYITCLFNLYAEYIMWNAGLDEAQGGIRIAGRNINNLRYTDDITLMAESEEELKNLLMKLKEESEKVGLKFNIQKT